MKRLLSYDPMTKTSTFHDYDHASKKTIIETAQNVDEILKLNKERRNDKDYKREMLKGDNNYHYASVPNTVLYDWKKKYNVDFTKEEDLPKIDRLLSSNEYQYLRTVNKI